MALLRIPNTLRNLTGGAGEVLVEAEDLGMAFARLEAQHPGFAERLMTDDGRLRGFVNVFVGEVECRQLDGLATPLGVDAVISVVPAVAGG